MKYDLKIDGWLPRTLNVLLRVSRWKRQAILDADAEMVGIYRHLCDVPKAKGARRVTATFTEPGTPADLDNRLKSLLDALVRAGLLVDDGPKWCVLGTPRSQRGPKCTTVVLEDLGDG